MQVLEAHSSRWWHAILTGLPYGVYKMGTGWYLWAIAGHDWGWILIGWGLLDFSTNLFSAFWSRSIPYCLLSALGYYLDRHLYWQRRRSSRAQDDRPPAAERPFRWEELALGVDALFSFSLVSWMIWNGNIPKIQPAFRRAWDVAVISNVLAVGLSRILHALRHPSHL